MASTKPLVVGIAVAILLAVASLTAYAYATYNQGPQRYQQPWSNQNGGMMGSQYGSAFPNQPRLPSQGPTGPYGPGMGMMGGWGNGATGMMGGSWNGNGPHCPMMGAFLEETEYNVTTEYNTVVIFNYAFYPDTLTVKAGTTVTWINMDFVAHMVESGTYDEPLELFDSGSLGYMGAFSYTFNDVGTYEYHCDPHPEMEGVIIVEA